MNELIRLFSPYFDKSEINVCVKTIKSHNWALGSGAGKVKEFENKFKKFTGAMECVALNSGTAALHLALNILDIKNKEVLVPSLTFVSTVHAIIYNGGIPVFVDVDQDTLDIDIEDLENKITKKSKVMIPVHFGGYPCNMDRIMKISQEKSINVVEDAAHACGSKFKGKKIGSIGELGCFSFHPVKNLAMPKGGAITINSKNYSLVKKKLNSLRWCGIDDRKGPFYDITSLGFNYYMDEISAAIGIEQLKKLSKLNGIRKKIAKRYFFELNISEKMPFEKNCSYHLYWIRVKNRKRFMKNMNRRGIETGVHYLPIHLMSFYDDKTQLPNTEKISQEIVTLPMHPNLTERDVDFVIKMANSFIG